MCFSFLSFILLATSLRLYIPYDLFHINNHTVYYDAHLFHTLFCLCFYQFWCSISFQKCSEKTAIVTALVNTVSHCYPDLILPFYFYFLFPF